MTENLTYEFKAFPDVQEFRRLRGENPELCAVFDQARATNIQNDLAGKGMGTRHTGEVDAKGGGRKRERDRRMCRKVTRR